MTVTGYAVTEVDVVLDTGLLLVVMTKTLTEYVPLGSAPASGAKAVPDAPEASDSPPVETATVWPTPFLYTANTTRFWLVDQRLVADTEMPLKLPSVPEVALLMMTEVANATLIVTVSVLEAVFPARLIAERTRVHVPTGRPLIDTP